MHRDGLSTTLRDSSVSDSMDESILNNVTGHIVWVANEFEACII